MGDWQQDRTNQPSGHRINAIFFNYRTVQKPKGSWDAKIKTRTSALVIYHSRWCYLIFPDWKRPLESVYMPNSCYFFPQLYRRFMEPTLHSGFTVRGTKAVRVQALYLAIGNIWAQMRVWCETRIREGLYMLSGFDQKTTVSKSWQLAASSSRNNRSDYWIRLHLPLVSEIVCRNWPGYPRSMCAHVGFIHACSLCLYVLCPPGLRLLERSSPWKRCTAVSKTCVQVEGASCLFTLSIAHVCV